MPIVRLKFRPYGDAAGEPNVVIDGSPTENTTLTLSHWPRTPDVPEDVWADLSAQMAFRYLDRSQALHGDATVVSNNHFDQDGLVGIDERRDVDLAVVTVPAGHRWSGHRFGGRGYDGVHPMAVHNVTDCSSLLLITEGSYRFTYRYEGWVKYRSRPIRRRVDLRPLAEALTAADTVTWDCEPVDRLTPELAPTDAGRSSLAPDAVTEMIVSHLQTAPAAFDPFVLAA